MVHALTLGSVICIFFMDDPRNLGITVFSNTCSLLKASPSMGFITSFICVLLEGLRTCLKWFIHICQMWLQLGEHILEFQAIGLAHGGCHSIKQTWY